MARRVATRASVRAKHNALPDKHLRALHTTLLYCLRLNAAQSRPGLPYLRCFDFASARQTRRERKHPDLLGAKIAPIAAPTILLPHVHCAAELLFTGGADDRLKAAAHCDNIVAERANKHDRREVCTHAHARVQSSSPQTADREGDAERGGKGDRRAGLCRRSRCDATRAAPPECSAGT